MEWVNAVQKALNYIEDHLLEELDAEGVARSAFTSSAYFQKIFHIVTGLTVGDYIRSRRLSLAGEEIAAGRTRVIDAAAKYGYESPESFTKAFTRFHGVTPSAARRTRCDLNYFSPLKVEIRVEGGAIQSRRLIPNVERLYENRAENYMFPSCMRSAMAALGEDAAYDFPFFAGVTGDLFTQTWLEPRWRYNDSYSNVCKETQVPLRRAFDACGYEYVYRTRAQVQADPDGARRGIVECIDRGLPVLAFGIVGPPVCSIVCGYSEQGKLLIGWSQFTGETAEDEVFDHAFSENSFQVRDGLSRVEALVFFGRKKERPSIGECVRESLLAIPSLAALAPRDGACFGRAAFEAWADSLLEDADFRGAEALPGPLDTYRSCVVQTGTNLHFVGPYLARAAALCPDQAARIRGLAALYAQEKEAFERLIDYQGGYFLEPNRDALLDRGFREGLSARVREVGRLYEQAARFMAEGG